MKILQVINSLAGGGAERLVAQLAPLMTGKGTTCDVLTFSDQDAIYLEPLREKGILVYIAPYKSRYDFRMLPYIQRLVRHGGYDIVHAHTFPAIYWVSLAMRFSRGRTKVLMTEHSTYNRRRDMPLLKPIERLIYRKYDAVISISEQTRQALLQWIKPRHPERYVVVQNGIDVQLFRDAQTLPLDELGVPVGTRLLGMVGSFAEHKNHAALLRALPQMLEDTHVVLAGTGPLLEDAIALVEKLGMKKRVHFLGFRRDIERIIKAVDILVIPSRWEGFGLVAVEAMACGTPVAAANVPGLREVVGDVGVLFDPLDSDDIAKVLSFVLDDEGLLHDCATQGVVRAEQYSISTMAEAYLSVYGKVCAGEAL